MGLGPFNAITRISCALMAAFALSACLPQEGVVKKVASTTHQPSLLEVSPQNVDNNIAPVGSTGVSKVAVGFQHVCALRSGKVSCWGLNRNGQIGNGESGVIAGTPDPLIGGSDTVKTVLKPFVAIAKDATDVAVGYEHTCAIRAGSLLCWGSNEYGQAGLGNRAQAAAPVEVLKDVAQVAARGRLTCAVTNTGKLYCFGTRLMHRDGKLEPKVVSKTPKELVSANVKAVALSPTHACVIVNSAVRCWGLNAAGEIGNGDAKGLDVDEPYEVFSSGVTQLALTDGRTCVVHQGGLKCWGASLGDRKIDATSEGSWKTPETKPYDAVFWDGIAPGKKVSASGTVLADNSDLMYGSYFHLGGVPRVIAQGVVDYQFSEAELVGCMMYRNLAMKCWGANTFGQLGQGVRSGDEPPITQARDVKF